MDNLLLSDLTYKNITDYLGRPSHALLIVGPEGSGKLTVSVAIAKNLLGFDNNLRIEENTYFKLLTPSANTITIDMIRDLNYFLKLKTSGSGSIRRVVIIKDSDKMTNEAQNAVLKMLEEPPLDTVLILTTSSEKKLTRTVVSRLQIIKIFRPTLNQALKYYSTKGNDEASIRSNYLLSGGLIGAMSTLLDTNERSDIFEYVNDAKQTLNKNLLERLLKADLLTEDKSELSKKLFAFKRVCHAALIQSVEKDQTNNIKKWLNALKQVNNAENALNNGANIKLLVTNLLLNL